MCCWSSEEADDELTRSIGGGSSARVSPILLFPILCFRGVEKDGGWRRGSNLGGGGFCTEKSVEK